VALLDYLSVYYMISRYNILVQSRANDLDDRRYLITVGWKLTFDKDYFHIEIQCRSLALNISIINHM